MATTTTQTGAAVLNAGGAVAPPGAGLALLSAVIGQGAPRPAAVALRRADGGGGFHLVLLDAGDMELMTLGPFGEDDIVAEWRALARRSGLPLMVELPDGAMKALAPQLGRLALGTSRKRRRHGLLAHRRPRFLVRRKTGRFPARPKVYREAELFEGLR